MGKTKKESKAVEVTQKELTDEQRQYLASFKEAMAAIDAKIKSDWENGKVKPKRAYIRLVKEGYWSPDIMGFEFALCTRGLCPLPSTLREYIMQVGLAAKAIYEKSQQIAEEKK